MKIISSKISRLGFFFFFGWGGGGVIVFEDQVSVLLSARHFWKIKTEFSPILTRFPPFLTSAIHPSIEKKRLSRYVENTE